MEGDEGDSGAQALPHKQAVVCAELYSVEEAGGEFEDLSGGRGVESGEEHGVHLVEERLIFPQYPLLVPQELGSGLVLFSPGLGGGGGG